MNSLNWFFLAITPTVILSLIRLDANKFVTFLVYDTIIIFLAWLYNYSLIEYEEAGVTLFGSLTLMTGYWINYRA